MGLPIAGRVVPLVSCAFTFVDMLTTWLPCVGIGPLSCCRMTLVCIRGNAVVWLPDLGRHGHPLARGWLVPVCRGRQRDLHV